MLKRMRADEKIKLALLEHGELRFGDLEKITGLSPPTLSKWLKKLEKEGKVIRVIIPTKDGVYYKLLDPKTHLFNLLPYWVLKKGLKLGGHLAEKYKIDDVSAFLFAVGFIYTGLLQYLRERGESEEFIFIIFFKIFDKIVTILDKMGEKIFDDEFKKEINEILESKPEEIEQLKKEIDSEVREFFQHILKKNKDKK